MRDDYPPDILSAAVAVVDRGYDEGLVDAVCRAIKAEREAQKERDAKICEESGDDDTMKAYGHYFAAAIRGATE
jgi:hypothetical protein